MILDAQQKDYTPSRGAPPPTLKLLERSGLTKELRQRKHYEKPDEARRRAKLRSLSALRKGKMQAQSGS
jgi:hypothetical protein